MLIHKQGISRFLLLPLAVNIALIISYVGLWIIAAREGYLWRADFTAFYTGGAIVRDGLGSQLYDLELQKQYQQEILAGRSFSEGVLPYNYPPHLALLTAPLVSLPLIQAYLIWTLIQLFILIGCLYLLTMLTQKWPRTEKILFLTASIALPALLINFLLGALSLWTLLCMLGWYAAVKHNKELSAGAWLLAGAVKPQAFVGIGLVSLMGRRWKIIAVVFIGFLGIFALTQITLGMNIWHDFFEFLIASSSYFDQYGISPAVMINFKGSLTLWLGKSHSNLINWISLIGFILSAIVTFFLWRKKWDPQSPVFSLRLAFTVTLNLLFSLHVNPQDGIFIIFPALLYFDYLYKTNRSRLAFMIFFVSCPLIILLDDFFLSEFLPVRIAVLVMGTLLVWFGYYLNLEKRSTLHQSAPRGSPL